MVRNKIFLAALCCFLIFTQSCIHGDLDDCPPMVNYAVAFKYTHNAWETDRVYDDVKKINLYVFDEDNLVYTTATKLSPNETHFTISLDLPMGNYHILAWGNVFEDPTISPFTISPSIFDKGITKLSDASLSLQRDANNHSHQEMEKLLFGDIDIEIPLYVSRTDTIPLVNDTKNVRVVIHWDHSGELRTTQDIIDYEEVFVHIDASNAVYNFDNLFTGINNVVYDPFDFGYDRSYLDRVDRSLRDFEQNSYYYTYEDFDESEVCTYDFTILRMMTNSPVMLKVERHKTGLGADSVYVVAEIDIVQDFSKVFESRGVTLPNRQAEFDKFDNYRLDLYLTFDELAGEYVTGGFKIEDWHVINQPTTPKN